VGTNLWAPEPGFQPYAGPKSDDGFSPMDTQAVDLGNYLRAEAKKLRQSRPEETIVTVVLPDGTRGQLIQRAAADWEVRVHLRRDIYRTFRARSRAAVLEAANEFHTSGTKITQKDEQS
jgi:hypothetical protein